MVTVVSTVEKSVVCLCGSVLKYQPQDVLKKQESSEGSYFFNMEDVFYIVCPVCNRDLKVEN